jgi:hypothetical protein
VQDGRRVTQEQIHHPDIEHTRLPDPVAEALLCLVNRVADLEREVADLRAGRTPAERPDDDAGCLGGLQAEIEQKLGMNGSPGA